MIKIIFGILILFHVLIQAKKNYDPAGFITRDETDAAYGTKFFITWEGLAQKSFIIDIEQKDIDEKMAAVSITARAHTPE